MVAFVSSLICCSHCFAAAPSGVHEGAIAVHHLAEARRSVMSPRMLFASRRSRAAVSMSSCIFSSSTSASSPIVSSDTVFFCRCRAERARTGSCRGREGRARGEAARRAAPTRSTSRRASCCRGRRDARAADSARVAPSRRATARVGRAASSTRALSSSVRQIGTITICVGASSGGMRSPLSSPCVITSPPTSRVDTPQLVFHANARRRPPSGT